MSSLLRCAILGAILGGAAFFLRGEILPHEETDPIQPRVFAEVHALVALPRDAFLPVVVDKPRTSSESGALVESEAPRGAKPPVEPDPGVATDSSPIAASPLAVRLLDAIRGNLPDDRELRLSFRTIDAGTLGAFLEASSPSAPLDLLLAIGAAESHLRAATPVDAGPSGLMQITPGTARGYRCGDLADVGENIRCGATILRRTIAHTTSLRDALAGYNGGLGNVRSTSAQRYGARVLASAEQIRATIVAAAATLPAEERASLLGKLSAPPEEEPAAEPAPPPSSGSPAVSEPAISAPAEDPETSPVR